MGCLTSRPPETRPIEERQFELRGGRTNVDAIGIYRLWLSIDGCYRVKERQTRRGPRFTASYVDGSTIERIGPTEGFGTRRDAEAACRRRWQVAQARAAERAALA